MSKIITRALEYYLVGTATFIANISLAWVLTYYGGLQYILATTIGFIVQTVVAFLANRKWAFAKKNLHIPRGLLVTTLVQFSALFIAIIGTALGVEIFHWSFLLSRIMAGLIAGVWGYIMDSRFTFGVAPLR